MDKPQTEQDLRREAIRRHLAGEPRRDICDDLGQSRRWFDKWRAEFEQNPRIDFADRSRAPHHSPHQIADEVMHAVVAARKTLEAAATSETKYGLIGPRVIQARLKNLGMTPPSVATIQRILHSRELTHPIGKGSDSAYYPWPIAWEVNAIHATDIITRHIRGGEKIENFHTIDHYSHAVYLSQHLAKSSPIMCEHLVATWSKLGLPQVEQLDNEGTFCGGHTHPHILGRVVRLCLLCGIEPFFTPYYEAKRNYQIETFHSLWTSGFWDKEEFRNCEHVQAEAPIFERWYHTVYEPPVLDGRTPAEMRRGAPVVRLTRALTRLIPEERLPIATGRLHFMRKVEPGGQVELLNETWDVGRKWMGEYVRATINTAKQTLTIWHQADADADWRLLRTRQFRLKESVCDVLPPFRRNRARCREYFPG
jgi:putative transposase